MRPLIPLLGAACAIALSPGLARAEEPARDVVVEMQCDRAGEPGRVRCTVEAKVKDGTIRWGDVVIRSSPAFALPLKGRIGPNEASLKEPTTWRWALALVAKTTGRGELVADVRLLVCTEGGCAAKTAEARAKVTVGQ